MGVLPVNSIYQLPAKTALLMMGMQAGLKRMRKQDEEDEKNYNVTKQRQAAGIYD
jgi:hypothetical protein